MTLLSTLTFDDIPEGAAVTAPPPWTTYGAAAIATTDAAAHGARGARFTTGTYGVITYPAAIANAPVVLDFYYTPRAISTQPIIAAALAGGTIAAQIRWDTARTLTLRNGFTAVATTPIALTIGTTYRIAWRIAVAGTQELRLYLGDDPTPLATISGPVTNSTVNDVRIGYVTAANGSRFDIDTLRIADDWLPPYYVAPPAASHTHFYVNSSGSLVPLLVTTP